MGPHDPMPMHGMAMSLLPDWLRVLWSIALLAVVITHVWHAWGCPGQHRWWHTGHTLMAAGMIVMYLFPSMSHPGLARAGVVVFAVLTCVLIVTTAWWWRRERVLNPLWAASALDMAVMVYMFVPMANQPASLGWVFIAYLVVQALAWAVGSWSLLPLYQPERAGTGTGSAAAPRGGATDVQADAGSGTAAATTIPTAVAPRVGLSGRVGLDVRLTLAVMAASMAYMLVIM